jgi:hypothetical protein
MWKIIEMTLHEVCAFERQCHQTIGTVFNFCRVLSQFYRCTSYAYRQLHGTCSMIPRWGFEGTSVIGCEPAGGTAQHHGGSSFLAIRVRPTVRESIAEYPWRL